MLLLMFQVGPEAIGLDIRKVREVIPRVRLRLITGGPAGLAGVFVYHGRVVPVVDLHRLTGHGPCPEHLSSRIILVPAANGDHLVGILAAQVADLRDVPGAAAAAPAAADGGIDLGPAVPDGQGVLRLLDPDRLLPAATRRQILHAAGASV